MLLSLSLMQGQAAKHTGNAPLEISGDAAGLQPLIQPGVRDGDAVRTPALLDRGKPRLDLVLQRVQAEVEMLGLAPLRGGAVELAARVDQPAGGLGLLVARRILLRL